MTQRGSRQLRGLALQEQAQRMESSLLVLFCRRPSGGLSPPARGALGCLPEEPLLHLGLPFVPSVSHLPVLNEEEGSGVGGVWGKPGDERGPMWMQETPVREGRHPAAVCGLGLSLQGFWRSWQNEGETSGMEFVQFFGLLTHQGSGLPRPACCSLPSPPFISPHLLSPSPLSLCLQFGVRWELRWGQGVGL